MAVVSEFAFPVGGGYGLPTIGPGYSVPSGDPSLGVATIGPGYSVPSGDPSLGTHVVQDAAIVCPRTGYPPCPAAGQPVVAGLGIINESDAWLTGRTAGLPGTATVQIARTPNGYASRMLGDVPNDFEASVDLQYIPVRQGWYYGHPAPGQLGMYVNEVQRSVGYGMRYARRQLRDAVESLDTDIFARPGAGWMLGAIGGVLAAGLIGVIASR